MAALTSITEAQVLKRDGLFQVQRVVTQLGARYLVKFAVADLDGTEESFLVHEYRLLETLRSRRALVPVRFDRSGGAGVAYYEDFAGVPLRFDERVAASSAAAFAGLVHELCAVLSSFHRLGFVLRGLCPQSFLREEHSDRVVLGDAAFAVHWQEDMPIREEYWYGSPYLPYAAPEVVGRTAHAVSERADLYALGATLYELASGRRPFETSDPAELVQCHLAKEPAPLHDLAPELPRGVADAVMTLLAKSPLDRYESVAELEERIRVELGEEPRSHPRVRQARALGAAAAVRLSPQLYGRSTALAKLREQLTLTRSVPTLVLVEGEAGAGKTSLLLRARNMLEHGHCCRGRFTQSGPSLPLNGWALALRDLARAILTQSAEDAQRWRVKIFEALGDGVALPGVLVPEWAAFLETSAESHAPATEGGLNRLAVAIHALLRCFAQPDAPVLVTLDDLQWADDSSLRILELVLELGAPANLVLLASVRTSPDAEGTGQWQALVSRLKASAVQIERLHLEGWGKQEVEDFLDDSFGGSLERAEAFAENILARTRGNPFFVHELLKTLLERRVLRFEPPRGCWSWDAEALRRLPPAESVVQLLTQRIAELPAALTNALCSAACLGTSFGLADFAAITGRTARVAVFDLEAALAEGLLLAGADDSPDPTYVFAHDRVFEACQALMSSDERASRCLAIGRTLLSRSSALEQSTHRVAGYFNVAAALIESDDERQRCATLNLKAGAAAMQRGAFSQALGHFQRGLEFLAPAGAAKAARRNLDDAWLHCPGLCRALYEGTAEAAWLVGDLSLMHEACDTLIERSTSPFDKVKAYEVRIGGLSSEKRFSEAVAVGCEILDELGLGFPRRPGTIHVALGYLRTKRRIFAGPVERLCDTPPNQDRTVKASSRIMQAMYSAAYFSHRHLFPLLVYRHIADSIRHGHEDYSCVTYIGFSLVLAAMGDFDGASRLSAVAQHLVMCPGAERHKGKVLMGHYVFVFPWTHHIRDSIPHLADGAQVALEHGDFEYGAHLLTLHSLARLHTGSSLGELAPEFEQHRLKIASMRQERDIIMQSILCQVVHDLRASEISAAPLSGPYYAAGEMLPRCLEPLDQNLAFHHHLAHMMLSLYLGRREQALEAAHRTREFVEAGAFGIYLAAVFTFWETLLCLWAARSGLPGARRARRRATRGLRRLRRWADSAPMNFLHKVHLVEAERWRTARPDQAAIHYERAIELALAHGYQHDTALAQEYAAEFYLERGMERLGRNYLRECYASYRRWGANAVLRRIENTYPQHFVVLVATSNDQEWAGLSSFVGNPDYRVLLKATQALSAERRLPDLLAHLLKTMFEHAGAQRAILVVERRGQLYVDAEADVDRGDVTFLNDERVDESARLSRALVRYVARSRTPVVLADAGHDERFANDPYVKRRQPKSVLCTPLVYQGRLLGVAYLENNRVSRVFTQARLEIANLLAGQAAVSIASAQFHALELEAQQAKINPHFLFNALSSVADLAVQDGEKAEAAIIELAQLYRYVLATSLGQRVTLNQELEMVRNYLAIEQLRFGSKLSFSISCDDDIAGVEVPGLLIQPLVENSVRHGVAPKMTPGRIWVEASSVADRCCIVVQDDGDGLTPSMPGTGFGLRSVQERLALVYGQEYTLAITRRGGHRVEIHIPRTAPELVDDPEALGSEFGPRRSSTKAGTSSA